MSFLLFLGSMIVLVLGLYASPPVLALMEAR